MSGTESFTLFYNLSFKKQQLKKLSREEKLKQPLKKLAEKREKKETNLRTGI